MGRLAWRRTKGTPWSCSPACGRMNRPVHTRHRTQTKTVERYLLKFPKTNLPQNLTFRVPRSSSTTFVGLSPWHSTKRCALCEDVLEQACTPLKQVPVMTSVAPAPETTRSGSKEPQARSKPSSSRNNKAAAEQQQATHTSAGGGGAGGNAQQSGGALAATTATLVASTTNAQDDDALIQSICQKSSVLLQPTITLTLYIPTSSVGAIIGRRGQNIALIQKLASQAANTHHPVRVSVIGGENSSSSGGGGGGGANHKDGGHSATGATSNNNPADASSLPYTYTELDFSDPNWTPVVIRADPKAAFTAAAKLEETLVHNSGGGGSSMTTVADASSLIDQVVLDVPISRQKHAAIVGKRGVTLANLSADTHVRIMVPNKDRRHDVVQLEGDLPHVKMCLDRVLQIVWTTSGGANSGTITAPGARPAAAGTTAEAPAHSQSIVLEQLPSQTKLRGLSRKTDTVIKKKRVEGCAATADDAGGSSSKAWQLTVSGNSAEQVQAAIALLQKTAESKAAAPSGTNPAAEASDTPTPQPTPNSRRKTRGRNSGGNANKGSGASNKRGSGGGGGNPSKAEDSGPTSSSSLST